jgi:DNA-binding NtrC family response regulator
LPPAPRTHDLDPSADLKLPPQGIDFEAAVSRMERSLLSQALERTWGNKKRAAELLRIKRTTFSAKWRSLEDKPNGA